MRHLAGIVLALALALALPLVARAAQHANRWVDPFIGTDGTGHTFPGASVPFGMVAPSPDTADAGWDNTSGYQYRAPRILGFSNSHMSGAGIGELGDVLLQPSSGTRWSISTTDFGSSYDKATEQAHPGFYAVTLRDHAVRVELSATQRVAVHRYTFQTPGRAQVLVDLAHIIHFTPGPRATRADSTVDPSGEITGSAHLRNWAERDLAFVIHFDHPIARVVLLPTPADEKASRYLLTFDLGTAMTLEARVALSTTDVDGARRNLRAVDGSNFERIRRDADRAWGALLDRVQIEAPERQKRMFYTALYHAFLHPSDIADVDGRVRGPTGAIITARAGHYYSTLSLWDIARGNFPLIALLVPERVDGIVLTLLEHERVQGYLPLFTAWGGETWCMIGNPALPVIAHAVATGFTGFDKAEALAAMVVTSTAPRANAPTWAQRDWTIYEQYGYLPYDREPGESVSKTLEYAWGDDAVARVALAAGEPQVAARFADRAQAYRKIFDAETQMMRGRAADGTWRTPFDPLIATSPLNNPGDYTEANAYQYTLTSGLHDPRGLVELLGGPSGGGEWLDRLFTTRGRGGDKFLGQEGIIGQYAHGNEPSHHIPYLYAWTDRPWKGHALIRRVTREFYADRPDGIAGNDDAGQMSAWYVFATLGFYPMVPASGDYVLGAPQVRAARIDLASGQVLDIRADGFGEGRPWARQARLRGDTLNPRLVPHADLVLGGQFRFTMAPLPRVRT
ncbi:MAG: GH92 family glycosyl hydrolase [Steroidobacteraceae bacterium]